MGMRNRRAKTKGPRWRCLRCQAAMWGELSAPAKAFARRVRRDPGQIVHVCGGCKALHLEAADGSLREPTAVERFRIEMEHGELLREIEATAFTPTTRPQATLIVPRGRDDA